MSGAVDFEVRQEDDAVPRGRIVRVGVAAIFVGAAGVLVAALVQISAVGSLRPAGGGTRPAPRELARVEQTPVRDTRAGIDLRRAQERSLAGWAWIDRDAGIAAIPIDVAMDVVAREAR